MGKSKKGKSVKKAQAGQLQHEEELKNCPHSFVFHRGRVGRNIGELIQDMRRVMAPYTASSLKVKKKNVLKDFISVAGPLNVTHFMIFTKTETTNNLRILRLPRGPTLTFQVKAYSLSRDIVSSLKHHNMERKQFLHHPLLVMNNFSGEGMHVKLMATMFQNMFPSINVNKVKLGSIRRCVLLHYDQEEKTIQFRHYNIRAVPVGMSRGVKKIVKAKVPNLSRFHDISEFLIRGGDMSESEGEQDGPHNEVILPQNIHTRGNIKSQKSAIRLTEIGPRLSLQLVKIEEGPCDGEVMFHQFITKSPEEMEALQKLRAKKKHAKEARKKQQEDNVKRKEDIKKLDKIKTLSGMKDSTIQDQDQDQESGEDVSHEPKEVVDDDAEYYRQEVGEDPDPDLMLGSSRKLAAKHKSGFKRRQQSKLRSSAPSKKARFGTDKFEKDHNRKRNKSDKFGGKTRNKSDKFGGKTRQRESKQFDKKYGKKSGAKRKMQPTGKRKFKGRNEKRK